MFQSFRGAFGSLHYHAFWRHPTNAADPSYAKKSVCGRLFSTFSGTQGQSSSSSSSGSHSGGPLPNFGWIGVIPLHTNAGLNKRLVARQIQYPTFKHPSFLSTSSESGFDADEDSFHTDPFSSRHHATHCNALRALFASHSSNHSPVDCEHEEKDNDHIVVNQTEARLLAKLEPVDNLEIADVDDEPILPFKSHSAAEVRLAPGTDSPSPGSSERVASHVDRIDLSGDRYSGTICNGSPHGKGQMLFANGDLYTGDFVAGVPSGDGIMVWCSNGRYEGHFANGLRQGYGVYTAADGQSSYQGEWMMDSRHGKGDAYVNGRCVYSGSWMCNERAGFGRASLSDGSIYEGEWRNGQMHGKGIVRLPDQSTVQGIWEHGALRHHKQIKAAPVKETPTPDKSLDVTALLGQMILLQSQLVTRISSIERKLELSSA